MFGRLISLQLFLFKHPKVARSRGRPSLLAVERLAVVLSQKSLSQQPAPLSHHCPLAHISCTIGGSMRHGVYTLTTWIASKSQYCSNRQAISGSESNIMFPPIQKGLICLQVLCTSSCSAAWDLEEHRGP